MRRRTEVVTTTWRQLWRRTSAAIADPVQTRWLLEEASGLGGAALLRDLDREADPESAARLESLMQRRLAGEPLQHVLGHWGFRTLDVAVDSRVLVPRPETELVVEVALSELDRLCGLRPAGGLLAVDLGTGSGVIALSLVAERPEVRVVATDRDPAALDVAAGNLRTIPAEAAARVQLRRGDWYQALDDDLAGRLDLIVANPPYLAEREWSDLDPEVRDFDPFGALVAGPSGLEAIAAIVAGAPAWLGRHGSVVVEIAPQQATAALELANEAGFRETGVADDLAGRARVLVADR
ncbi:MAG: peptide chain release factor N(5)-glutamine methyltransferase [Acidimicrobiales bacterium]|jgi:release factor glutamine methyltransferase